MKKSLKTIAQTLLVSSLILGSLSTLPVLAQTAVTTDAEASEEVSEEDKEEEEEKEDSKEKDKKEKEDKKEEDKKEEDKKKDKKKKETSKVDFKEIEKEIEAHLEPETMDVVFEGSEEFSISDESGDLTTTLDGYKLYSITNFSRNAKIPFDNQREEGGIIVLHFTIKNESDEDVYVGNPPTIEFPNTYISSTNSLTSHEYEGLLKTFEAPLAAGEEMEGFLTYAITPDEMAIIEKEPKALMDLPGFRPEQEFNHETEILGAQDTTIPFSDEATESVSAAGDLYPDKMVAENWGEKKVLKEDKPKGVEGEFDDVTVKVDGYQISEFTPNSEYESSFAGFNDGVITINVPLTVENESDQTIDLSTLYAKMILGDLIEVKSDLSVQVDPEVKEIPTGESGTIYLTFLLDGELYKKFEGEDFVIFPSVSNTKYEPAIDYESIALEVEQ